MTLSSQKLIELKKAINFSTEEVSVLLGISYEQLASWESGTSEPNPSELFKIILTIATSKRTFINSTAPKKLKHKLTKVKHFNEKLAENAIGADSTLHQCIDDEVSEVIKSIK
jgi:transcriptional regulator with XRE-family HTH domain